MSRRPGEQPAEHSVYLGALLEPFQRWLASDDVTEILVNKPGELWIETASGGRMTAVEAPEVDALLLERLAQQVARVTSQGVSRQQPVLGASLPGGVRLQFICPPATRAHPALAIRRHRAAALPLEAFASGPIEPARRPYWLDLDPVSDPVTFLRAAVAGRATILVSGGTSSGKTSLLDALMTGIGQEERLIVVEDTPELQLRHPNAVGLVSVRGPLGEARIGTDDLLQAALRMRPDRIVLGEMRGPEAWTFLRAINTGHPGSLSTIHANSTEGALAQLGLLSMQAGLGLSLEAAVGYARQMIDIVVQTERRGSQRRLVEIAKLRK